MSLSLSPTNENFRGELTLFAPWRELGFCSLLGEEEFFENYSATNGAVKERRRNERDGEENFVTFVTRLDLGGGGEGSLPRGRRNGPRGSPANVLRRKSSYRDLAPV